MPREVNLIQILEQLCSRYFRSLNELLNKRKVVAHGAMNMKIARGIGLLINVDDDQQYNASLNFKTKLESMGKIVSIIGFCKNAKTKGEVKIPVFDKSTLNDICIFNNNWFKSGFNSSKK